MTKNRITYLAKDKEGRYYICADTDRYTGDIHNAENLARLFYEENEEFDECDIYEMESD